MNLQHIRVAARLVALAALVLVVVGVIHELVDADPVQRDDLWGALNALLVVVGFVGLIETLIGCTDRAMAGQERIIAATPTARAIVAATLQEMETEAAQEAALPYIADGQRTR